MTEKLKKEEALARIKALISKYYEDIGRKIEEYPDETKEELIEEIDEILNKTHIPIKNLIIEKLSIDEEIKEKLKNKWK